MRMTKEQFKALNLLSWAPITWEKRGWADGEFSCGHAGIDLNTLKTLHERGLCTWEASHSIMSKGRVVRGSEIHFSITVKGIEALIKKSPASAAYRLDRLLTTLEKTDADVPTL